MPRPCQVSHRPGSASRYSPWRRSSNWPSRAACVGGSGCAPQISHLNTTETGIRSRYRAGQALPTGLFRPITAGELQAGTPPLRLDVEGPTDTAIPQILDERPVRNPRGLGVQPRGGVGFDERHVLVREPRHRARHTDTADVRAPANAVGPAADRDIALDGRPLTAELDQAAAVAMHAGELACLRHPGAVASLVDRAAEDRRRPPLVVEFERR